MTTVAFHVPAADDAPPPADAVVAEAPAPAPAPAPASSAHTNALRSCEHVTILFVTGCQSMPDTSMSCCRGVAKRQAARRRAARRRASARARRVAQRCGLHAPRSASTCASTWTRRGPCSPCKSTLRCCWRKAPALRGGKEGARARVAREEERGKAGERRREARRGGCERAETKQSTHSNGQRSMRAPSPCWRGARQRPWRKLHGLESKNEICARNC